MLKEKSEKPIEQKN